MLVRCKFNMLKEFLRSRFWRKRSDMALSPGTIGEVTQMLTHWDARDPSGQAKLLEVLYPELKRIAEFRMRRERSDHTLQPTALVNEFVVELYAASKLSIRDRVHFLAIASQAMRRILVDYARSRNAQKRGGGCKIQLDTLRAGDGDQFAQIIEIDELLTKLAAEDPRMAKVVELRYFGGLSNSEVGEILNIAERTVKRDWQVARAWLYAHVRGNAGDAHSGMG